MKKLTNKQKKHHAYKARKAAKQKIRHKKYEQAIKLFRNLSKANKQGLLQHLIGGIKNR